MSNDKIDYKELANYLLDHYVEGWGVNEAIYFLHYHLEYSKDQIFYLGFNEEDIDRVIRYSGHYKGEDDE